MRWISHAGVLIGGFIAGAVACWFVTNGFGAVGLQHLSSQQLGRVLLGRVSETFVFDTRESGRGVETGVVFYDTPVPVSDFLCSLTEFNVYPNLVTGEAPDFPGTMDARQVYAVWRDPSEAQGRFDPSRLSDRNACSNYRDFRRLVRGYSDFDVAEGLRAIALARHHAQTGSAQYPIVCQARSETCDATALLRAVDLSNVTWVHETSEDALREGGYTHRYEVWVVRPSSSHGHGDIFTIETFRPRGPRGLVEIRGVSILVNGM